MKTTERIKEVFGLDDLFDVMCFIYDSQMVSGGGIMKGFKGYLRFESCGAKFVISDGWEVVAMVEIVKDRGNFDFYSIPFAEALQEAIEKFIDLCYTGGEVGPNPVKR